MSIDDFEEFDDVDNGLDNDLDAGSDFGDMEYDLDEDSPPEESGNRTFIIVAGVLGAITVLALVCIAAYAFVVLPRQRALRQEQDAAAIAQQTQVALGLAQTQAARNIKPTATVTPIPPTSTPTSSPTPVVALPTNTAAALGDPRTATVSALLTQAAAVTRTAMPTSTALPSTGFVEDVGIPGLLGMAALLIAVIFLARRLRTAN
jgi:LPXTG-motif cell wall-anchored protein